MNDALPYPYTGPPALRAMVHDVLQGVIDPEVAMSIVDVGLVYGVRVDDGLVQVDLTMTSAACPVADALVSEVEQGLDRVLPPELKLHVELVWEPPWTPERISAAGRAAMGW